MAAAQLPRDRSRAKVDHPLFHTLVHLCTCQASVCFKWFLIGGIRRTGSITASGSWKMRIRIDNSLPAWLHYCQNLVTYERGNVSGGILQKVGEASFIVIPEFVCK